jgi:hypothetical protein
MIDPTSQLRVATTRAKSDVANKLVSMFLHELSRKVCRIWAIRVDGEEYAQLVRESFENLCPYCRCDLMATVAVIEHLDGMNRYRTGLHIPGNVLVACRKCNNEKRRDDSRPVLTLASSGWESFLSHDGSRCPQACRTCQYWASIWGDQADRDARLSDNLMRIRAFRGKLPTLADVLPKIEENLPTVLQKLYLDCQEFAKSEISTLLDRIWEESYKPT